MKRNILEILLVLTGLVSAGCQKQTETPSTDKAPIAIAFSGLSANGTSGSVTTTALTLTFDLDPVGLAASDNTVTGATMGALTGTGITRTLAVSAITVPNAADLTLAIAGPAGYAITPASRTVAARVAPTIVLADEALDAFVAAFCIKNGTNYHFRADTDPGNPNHKADFWKEAEMIEMVEDAYDRTGSSAHKTLITNLINGFIAQNGTDWKGNKYNDDIAWMVIASARGYEATGNTLFRDYAKSNFDTMYARAWDTTFLGGGLWWTTDQAEKNACINGPAAIGAYLLSVITGDASYKTKATAIYNWEKSTLYVSTTGAVHDSIKRNADGTTTTNSWASTYNQGTFIGAAHFLEDPATAQKALDYAKNHMTDAGIIRNEASNGDLEGFKGILLRWASRYLRDRGLAASYGSWFQQNANTAWALRDTRGLMQQNWAVKTDPQAILASWACSPAVVLMQVTPAAPAGVIFYRDANYVGVASSTLAKGEYATLPADVPNDWMSSLAIPVGWTVEVYQDGNFGGTKWTFTTDTPDAGAALKQMSSFKILSN